MKAIDVIAAVLLVVGGLNWGLVGVADLNVVALLFGQSVIATAVYVLVGLAAIYQAVSVPAIQKRWHVQPAIA
jgi:uncharacterized protein